MIVRYKDAAIDLDTPIKRNLHGNRPPKPEVDWDEVARRRAADPTWQADAAFADWIAPIRKGTT